jgi:hypothetical protein
MVSGCKYQDGSFNKQSALSIDGRFATFHMQSIARSSLQRECVGHILHRHFVARVRTVDARRQTVPQSDPLLGEPDANHASIIQRTLLREIALFDHLFDIVRNVRAQITTA